MDTIITNSENVRSRIKKYLGIDSRVIYPPCETEKFNWLSQEDFYLSTARLDPLKRVDLVVKAFQDMPEKKLKVISGGPDMPRIKKLAQGAENIQVLGWVDERMLVELVGRCVATIYISRDEDFGMAPIESMAAGKPVIGVAEGGLRETVVDSEKETHSASTKSLYCLALANRPQPITLNIAYLFWGFLGCQEKYLVINAIYRYNYFSFLHSGSGFPIRRQRRGQWATLGTSLCGKENEQFWEKIRIWEEG